MARRSKRYNEVRTALDRSRRFDVEEALGLIKAQKAAAFDETVEIAVKLGVDPKQSDQVVRGTVSLPHGSGRDVRVIVFVEGERAQASRTAGAIEAGGDEMIKKVEGGWLDFDVAIAAPDMMRKVGKLGRILGPQGKMPSPKSGTVTEDVAAAVAEFRAGKIEYRTDATGNLHAPMGKASFPVEHLKENVERFLQHIAAARPPAAKGKFIQKASISRTMGPALKLAV